MIDPIEQFRAHLLAMKPGESYIYHRGRLARDRAEKPAVHNLAMVASGLQMLTAVVLSQKRVGKTGTFEYGLRTKRQIRNVDFDHGRKHYLANLQEE